MAMLVVACAPAASAATLTWSATGTSSAIGGTGTWDTSALRWTTTGSTWSAWNNAGIDTAVFAGTAGTVTLNTGITAGGLTFSTTGYTLTGGTLTLASSGTLPTITLATGVSGTIASTLAGTGGLVMAGSGTAVLTGTNTYTGTTSVTGGVLQIGAGSTAGSVSSSSPLALGGGTLFVNRSDAVTQAFAGTTLNAGASSGTATATATVNLGAITRNAGATLNIATTGTFITSSANTSGILPGVTYGGTTWAVSGTTTAITGLAAGSYTTTTTAGVTAGNYSNANIDVDSSAGTLSGVITPNTLRFNSAGARTVTLAAGGASTVPSGILVTANVGNNASTITGGTLAGSSGGDLAVIQNNTSNTLTIASVIANNSTATGLTKSGTGTLVLTAANTYTGATQINAGTLQVGAGAAAGSVNTASTITGAAGATLAFNRTDTVTQGSQFASAIGGAINVSQLGSGTLVLNGANTYSGSTTIGGNGTVTLGASQSLAGPLVFGASAGASTLGSLNLSAASGTFGGLLVQTNASGTNRITVGSGQTLATDGNVYVYGSNGGTTNLTVAGTTSGVGAWTITNPLASGTFLVGGNATVGNPGVITVDLSSLGTFSANLSGASSLFRIGWSFSNGSDNMILRLAVSSTITAKTIGVGDAGQAGNTPFPVLSLGSGVQRLNTDSLNVAQSSNARSGGAVVFTGSTGSVVLRAQNGTGRSNVLMTAPGVATSALITGTIDFRGHDADLLIGGLTMTSITGAGINASYSSTFSFDQGTLDVTSGTLGFVTQGNLAAGATPNATLNLGSGSNTAVNTTTMGSLWMATTSNGNTLATVNVAGVNTSVTVTGTWRLASNTSTSGTATGVLNISGGTVNANQGIIMRNGNGSAGPVNGTISITGGALVSGSDITSVGTFAAGAAVLTLDGGRLDMGGFAIGGSGQTVTGTFLSGTLSRLGQYNNGGTFTKSGTGTLTLTGTNGFSGATTISGGILSFSGTNGLRGTSGVTIAGGAGLTYTGGADTFAKNVTVTPGSGTGTIRNTGGGVLTLSGTLSKDNSVLRLSGGSFNVTGLITGTTVGTSDLIVAGTSSVTLSNTNTYNGPTFVIESSTLSLGITNAIPNSSVVTLGDATTVGTLQLAGYTDAIGGLAFGAGGGTLRLAATSTTAAPLTALTGTMTLTNGTLDLAGSGSTAGLYRVLAAQSIAGSFASVTGTSAAYQVVTTSTTVDYQQRAVLGTVTVTNPAVSIITGGSAAFTYTVANTALSGGATLSYTGTGLSNVNGVSSGSAAAASTSGATSGMVFTGTSLGSSQGTFTVSAPSAFGSTSATGTVTVNVLDHSNAALSLASGGGQTIITGGSFATVGFNLTNAGANRAAVQVDSLTNLTGGTGSAVVLSGGTASYTSTIVDTITVGTGTLSVGMLAGDQQSLSGASALQNRTATATYTILDHAKSSLGASLLTSTTVSLGTWNTLSQTWESGTNSALFSIFNIASPFGAGFTANLALLGVTGTANGFTTNLGTYANIAGGTSGAYSVYFDPTGFDTAGEQSTTFVLSTSDDTGLSGATASNTLYLTASVTIVSVPEPAAIVLAGVGLAVATWSAKRRRRRVA